MWKKLPVADPTKASCSERRYFCDAKGWVREGIAKALAAAAEVRQAEEAGVVEEEQEEQEEEEEEEQQQQQEEEGEPKWGRLQVSTKVACTEALPHMRILAYNDVGGDLPPHTDLSRTDTHGRKSTHTFLLYLADCEHGGETVLLRSVRASSGTAGTAGTGYATEHAVDEGQAVDASNGASQQEEGGAATTFGESSNQSLGEGASQVLAAIAPVRGRLFLFPHVCPHAGLPVASVPKVLVRGELF
jgi:hypothetical protein